MNSLRKHSRFGSWLAFFALAIQLVLSFGHVHLDDIQELPPAALASFQAQDGSDTAPADRGHPSGERDYCAICAALSLTSNSVLPTVSLLATPISTYHEWFVGYSQAQISFVVVLAFQARAPPRTI